MNMDTFLQNLPKTELHLHLEGSVKANTFADLAKKNNVEILAHNEPADLYKYADLVEFLVIYNLVSESVQKPDDFHRITYECLEHCANHGARYVELFFSPESHLRNIDYPSMLDGVIAGARDAEKDKGVAFRILPAINRELGPDRAVEFIEMVDKHRRDEVIGVGLDFNEAPHPPELFEKAFKLAAKKGLHRTSHEGEVGPAQNVKNSLDVLGCERVDHGYFIVDDKELMKRCAEEEILFTVCPTTTTYTTPWTDLNANDHAIKTMADAGLKMMINSDDPGLFNCSLTDEYKIVHNNFGFGTDKIKEFILNGIEGSWLDDATKRSWKQSWSNEIDEMINQLN